MSRIKTTLKVLPIDTPVPPMEVRTPREFNSIENWLLCTLRQNVQLKDRVEALVEVVSFNSIDRGKQHIYNGLYTKAKGVPWTKEIGGVQNE
jgi:hypothetical protein